MTQLSDSRDPPGNVQFTDLPSWSDKESDHDGLVYGHRIMASTGSEAIIRRQPPGHESRGGPLCESKKLFPKAALGYLMSERI